MKKTIYFICCCLIISTVSYSQSADERQVETTVESFRKALIDPTKESRYGHSSGKLEDKATFMASLISKASDFVTVELTQQTIKVVGNTAIVRHNLTAQTNDGGKPGTAKLGVLLIWQKQQGKWKLLARQAFKLL
jgi:hypothetical protein